MTEQHYYFPKDFKFDRDYFSVTVITRTTHIEMVADVLIWLDRELDMYNRPRLEDFYWWITKNTLKNIDVDYEHGVFFHHWLNAYLYQVGNMIWVDVYESNRPSMKEKEACKLADSKRKEFTDFAKKNWI